MDSKTKKALRAQYDQRKPDMGIVCWQNGEKMWIAISRDANADYNGSLFQLKLGSWPNREMQKAYTENPEAFQWSLLKKLEYKECGEDHSDDLELLYMMCMEEYPRHRRCAPAKNNHLLWGRDMARRKLHPPKLLAGMPQVLVHFLAVLDKVTRTAVPK